MKRTLQNMKQPRRSLPASLPDSGPDTAPITNRSIEGSRDSDQGPSRNVSYMPYPASEGTQRGAKHDRKTAEPEKGQRVLLKDEGLAMGYASTPEGGESPTLLENSLMHEISFDLTD